MAEQDPLTKQRAEGSWRCSSLAGLGLHPRDEDKQTKYQKGLERLAMGRWGSHFSLFSFYFFTLRTQLIRGLPGHPEKETSNGPPLVFTLLGCTAADE